MFNIGNRCIVLDVNASDTILHVKKLLQQRETIPFHSMSLTTSSGKSLSNNDQTLENYNISGDE